ncbi:MAG TPA: sulfatase [Terriglobales bacterium]
MQPRSLILITIDCLRADHVGFMGYQRPTTPFLDSLTGESMIFRHATAAGTPTYYAMPAIMASRYPLALGRDLIGVASDENTLASVLAESGFATAGFSAGNPYISARFGYERGFDTFRDFLDRRYAPEFIASGEDGLRHRANQAISRACHHIGPLGAAYDELYFRYCQRVSERAAKSLDELRRYPAADVIVDSAISWLKQHSAGRFFLWLHFMDPHAPYYPRREALQKMGHAGIGSREAIYLNSYWSRSDLSNGRLAKKREQVTNLYDAGIRWADEQICRLASSLVELNAWDKCALAVTADHGEEFLDHGARFHSPFTLKQEMLHVPFQVRVPGIDASEVGWPVSSIDIAPTLLDMLDVPAPADFRGRSWWNSHPAPQKLRPVLSECVHGCTNPFRSRNRLGPRILAVQKGNYKLVVDFATGLEELFHLDADPKELSPLPLGEASATRKELLQFARKHLAESHQSRDFDRRQALLVRDLRLEWAHSATRN